MKRNYYRADMNAPPKKIDTETQKEIFNRYDKGYQYLKMNLYKFLGFKEALTEEQIQAIIKKYNLLDGVDEIEIS